MTMITPSYLGETIEYSSLHACRSTLEDPTMKGILADPEAKETFANQVFYHPWSRNHPDWMEKMMEQTLDAEKVRKFLREKVIGKYPDAEREILGPLEAHSISLSVAVARIEKLRGIYGLDGYRDFAMSASLTQMLARSVAWSGLWDDTSFPLRLAQSGLVDKNLIEGFSSETAKGAMTQPVLEELLSHGMEPAETATILSMPRNRKSRDWEAMARRVVDRDSSEATDAAIRLLSLPESSRHPEWVRQLRGRHLTAEQANRINKVLEDEPFWSGNLQSLGRVKPSDPMAICLKSKLRLELKDVHIDQKK